MFWPYTESAILPNAGMSVLGSKIRALRLARRLSQAQLGRLIGVSQSAIAQIEGGKTETLSGKVLAGLCEHLHVVPQFLVAGDAPQRPDNGVLEAEALHLFRSLDDNGQHAAVLMLRGLADAARKLPASAPRCVAAKAAGKSKSTSH
jgi:transcriptional regulator with XRE-family HTH domain